LRKGPRGGARRPDRGDRRGRPTDLDIDRRELSLDLPDEEIARRIAAYEPPPRRPEFRRGVMGKYAATVSSAAQGAVTS
jgi:dihydroxy-acid dehydratase